MTLRVNVRKSTRAQYLAELVQQRDQVLDAADLGVDDQHIRVLKDVEELAAYLVNEIQEVYRLQGVLINDKHIEVIVRQMLQKVEITDQGDTDMISGEQIDKIEFDQLNARAKEEGKAMATGTPVLLGITKVLYPRIALTKCLPRLAGDDRLRDIRRSGDFLLAHEEGRGNGEE